MSQAIIAEFYSTLKQADLVCVKRNKDAGYRKFGIIEHSKGYFIVAEKIMRNLYPKQFEKLEEDWDGTYVEKIK